MAMLRAAKVPRSRQATIVRATQGFPFLLSLAIEEFAVDNANSALFLKKFYDRTTRWMDEREKEWFNKVCYLDAVNQDSLAALFSAAEVPRVLRWFQNERSIRDPDAPVFTVRPLIREKCLRLMALLYPARHAEDLAAAALMNGEEAVPAGKQTRRPTRRAQSESP